MKGVNPLNMLAQSFAIGAVVGLVFLAGASALVPDIAASLLDLHRDGIDVKDALAFAWLFGQIAVLVGYILPGIMRH